MAYVNGKCIGLYTNTKSSGKEPELITQGHTVCEAEFKRSEKNKCESSSQSQCVRVFWGTPTSRGPATCMTISVGK